MQQKWFGFDETQFEILAAFTLKIVFHAGGGFVVVRARAVIHEP